MVNYRIEKFSISLPSKDKRQPYTLEVSLQHEHSVVGKVSFRELEGFVKLVPVPVPPSKKWEAQERKTRMARTQNEMDILQRIRGCSPFLAECIFSTWHLCKGNPHGVKRIGCMVMTPYQMTLQSYMNGSDDAFEFEKVRRMGTEILLGLDALHSRNIVHGKLRIENIMIDHGHVRITNFSASTVYHEMTVASSGTDVRAFGNVLWIMVARSIYPDWQDRIIEILDCCRWGDFQDHYVQNMDEMQTDPNCARHKVYDLITNKMLRYTSYGPPLRELFRHSFFNWCGRGAYLSDPNMRQWYSQISLRDIKRSRAAVSDKVMTFENMKDIVPVRS